jgi:Fe-S cluster assembly protein SufD
MIMSDTTATTSGFTREAFNIFLANRREPDWLRERRKSAWQAFAEMPMPGRTEEEWARTDIRPLKLDRFALPAAESLAPEPPPLLTENVELAGSTVTVNGTARAAQLNDRWREQGVLFGHLSDFLPGHESLVRRYLFASHSAAWPDRFAALHTACWSTGTFLYVPRGVVVDQPLHTQAVITDGGIDLTHTLVVLDEGAEATFLAEMGSCAVDDAGFHCGATEIFLAPSARLRFVNLQDWGHKVWHFAHQLALVDRDASLQWTVGALGSRLAKVNQQVQLVGAGGGCEVNGVLFAEGSQHLSYHTLQHHRAPHCRSDFLYKAALQDFSRTVWRGMIKVDRGAQKTDGYQRNDNLLLSQDCRADAIPGLEIEADDVRCTHGATTGRVDEELIFYAQSRGFTRSEAIRLVVTGFLQQVFDRITIPSVREALSLAIARRIRAYT